LLNSTAFLLAPACQPSFTAGLTAVGGCGSTGSPALGPFNFTDATKFTTASVQASLLVRNTIDIRRPKPLITINIADVCFLLNVNVVVAI